MWYSYEYCGNKYIHVFVYEASLLEVVIQAG